MVNSVKILVEPKNNLIYLHLAYIPLRDFLLRIWKFVVAANFLKGNSQRLGIKLSKFTVSISSAVSRAFDGQARCMGI